VVVLRERQVRGREAQGEASTAGAREQEVPRLAQSWQMVHWRKNCTLLGITSRKGCALRMSAKRSGGLMKVSTATYHMKNGKKMEIYKINRMHHYLIVQAGSMLLVVSELHSLQ
jgi:hypothetical protein